jgi:toxin ParE1/3/4
MKVAYSRRALSQLASVYDYLVTRSPDGGRNVTASIRRTIVRLRDLPRLGKRTDEEGVYVLIEPKYQYSVFYRIDDLVMVLRILHKSQR